MYSYYGTVGSDVKVNFYENNIIMPAFSLPIGSSLAVLTGCFVSQTDNMAAMASPATRGYHSVVSYSWERDECVMQGEDTALLYTGKEGMYKCHVSGETAHCTTEFHFSSECHTVYV